MGCNPFGKLISLAFGKHEGRGRKSRKRSRKGRRRVYSPPPPYAASQSTAKSVIYRDDGPIVVSQPVQTIQPPGPGQVRDNHHHHHHPRPEEDISPSNHAHATAEHEGVEEAEGYAIRGGDTCYQTQYPETPPSAGTVYLYVPSPVPSVAWGWREHVERRREYFGGEYRYGYPTPVREGIYSIATDANRLTTIFSDENPNACSII